jgi:hypothetical protein
MAARNQTAFTPPKCTSTTPAPDILQQKCCDEAPDPQNLKVYIGEELVVEGGEKGLDVGFIEAGAFEDDDICGRKGPWEVTEIAVRAASSSS